MSHRAHGRYEHLVIQSYKKDICTIIGSEPEKIGLLMSTDSSCALTDKSNDFHKETDILNTLLDVD